MIEFDPDYRIYAKQGFSAKEAAKRRGVNVTTVYIFARPYGGWEKFKAKVLSEDSEIDRAVSQAFKAVLGYDPAVEVKGE